ncbi:MAG: T9SS type A sorting domain-containing protein [Bacteroidia bacterium]
MRTIIQIIVLISVNYCWAQNIVPNSSFEDSTGCPNSNGQIEGAISWSGIAGSPDYYHECGINGWSIPVSWGGGGYANSGHAYAAISLRSIGSPSFREFIGATLTSTLIPGKRYNVEFYTSQADSSWYAIKNIGAYFSIGEPQNSVDVLLNKIPQVKYEGDDYLDDKLGWTKIEGSFIADGGENFITIGNFDDNNETDTLFVGGGVLKPSLPNYWTNAYYFIDDVSVTVDTTTGIDELEPLGFELYPNPNDGNMYLTYRNLYEKARFELYDVTSRKISAYDLNSEYGTLNISEQGISNGVYLYRIINENSKYKFGKVVIKK